MSKMEAEKWFKTFIEQYGKIVDSSYADKRDTFPFYPPIDVSVYIIDDPKGIFPQIVAFFESGFDEWPASNVVYVRQTKIEWKTDPDELEPMDRRIEIDTKWHETFYDEQKHPGLITQEPFEPNTLSSNATDLAMIYVQRHLIYEQQREHFEAFLKLSELRKSIMGIDRMRGLQSKLSNIQNMKEMEKVDALCEAFWIIGFEVVNLERLKDIPQYRKLNHVHHVDLITILLSEKVLVAIEEGQMNKERWYKVHSLDATLNTLGFLGAKEDWKVTFLTVGRRSKGIDYLHGNVQTISSDYFAEVFLDFVESKNWAPALTAIKKVLGYKLDFFKTKT